MDTSNPLLGQHSSPKIPRTITFSENFLKEKIENKYDLESFGATKTVLLKYCLKYYHHLEIDSDFKSISAFSKVKQVKTIDHFRYEIGFLNLRRRYKLTRTLLKTKRKSIKFPNVVTRGYRNLNPTKMVHEMDICRVFPRIKTLSASTLQDLISQQNKDFSPFLFQRKTLKLHQHFWSALAHLKNLEICLLSDKLWLFLQRLQSAQRFLASLETFWLKLCFAWKDEDPQALSQFVVKHQDLLKHVTHITFTSPQIDFRDYKAQVNSILTSCSTKLIGISFPLSKKKGPPQQSHGSFCFQSLQNVTMLKLQIRDVWDFIENFEFPPRLEDLALDFDRSDFDTVFDMLYPEGPALHEKHKVLLSFFEKLRQLACLTSLELTIDHFPSPNEMLINFLLPLLRSTPRLEKFECYLELGEENKSLDLSVFLDGIYPLQQLKSFKIFGEHDDAKLNLAVNPQKHFVVPDIPLMSIDTQFSPDFNFKQFLRSIPKSQTRKQIDFTSTTLHSVGSFTKLLAELNNAVRANPLKISLEIILHLDSYEDIPKNFQSPIMLHSNLNLTLKIYILWSDGLILQMKEAVILQGIFSKFRLNVFLKWKVDGIDRKPLPFILNNY